MKRNLVRRILSFALAGALILGLIPNSVITAFAATEYTYENFKYTVSNNEATITGCVDESVELISIPATVDAYTVVAIGSYAFEEMSQLKTVWFSNSIKKIEAGAFKNCDALEYIEIPNHIETLESYSSNSSGVFYGCDNLQEVIIGDGVKEIPSWTFFKCPKLESVKIGQAVQSIGQGAFMGSALRSVVIPDSVITIGYEAFSSVSTLSSVLLGNGLKTIEVGAFKECDSLVSITIPDSVETIKSSSSNSSGAFYGCDMLREVIIGDGATDIPSWTFFKCPSLESVIIGDAVESIGQCAFAGSSLKTLVIPDSVLTIGYEAFSGCTSLQNIKLGNGLKTIEVGAFKECDSLVSITIPDSVETIKSSSSNSSGAFYGCDKLQEVVVGNGAKAIPSWTFFKCPNLESVILGSSVESIGQCAFAGSSLKTLVVPDSVSTIGYEAFSGCVLLHTVHLGNGLKTIETGAFKECDSLLSITIPDSVETIKSSSSNNSGAFYSCDKLQEVIVGEGVTDIPSWTFFKCPNLEVVIIGSSVESIGQCAFAGSAVKTIVIPDNTISIGYEAFSGCTSLYAVKLGKGLKTIETGAFKECDNLLSVEIPNSVETIKSSSSNDSGAFYNCDKLQEIIIGDGVKEIPAWTFFKSPKISTAIIGTTVTSIGNYSFASCSNLSTVLIFDNVTSISDSAFDSSDMVEFYGYEGSYAQEYALAHNIPFHIVSRDLAVDQVLSSISFRKADFELITGDYIGVYTAQQGLTNIMLGIHFADDLLEDKTKLEEIAEKATFASTTYNGDESITKKEFTWKDIYDAVSQYKGKYISIFYYYENVENAGVETGLYICTAKYDGDAQTYSFTGAEWLQHDTYDFADIKNAAMDGDYLVGDIWGQASSGGIWWGTTYQEVGNIIVKKEGQAYALPKDAETLNGHTYKLIEQNVTWKQAEVICKQMGGHLVAINSLAEKTLVEKMAAATDSVWLGGYSENDAWYWSTGEDFVSSILNVEPSDGYLVYQNSAYFAATTDSTTYFICEWNYTNSGSLKSSIKEGNILFNVFDYETFETVNADVSYDDLNKTLTITAAGYNTVSLTDVSYVSGKTYSFAMVKVDSNTGISAVSCNGYDALLSNSVSGITDKTLNIKVYPAIGNVSKYQIVQDFAVICENSTGEFSISTDSLIKDKRIRIRVIDSNSQKYEYIDSKIFLSSVTSRSPKITGGNAFEITVPEYLGGFTVGLNLKEVPLMLYDDGNTIKVAIGVEDTFFEDGKLTDDSNLDRSIFNTFKETIDDSIAKRADKADDGIASFKDLSKKNKFFKQASKSTGGFDLGVWGYLEIKYDESGIKSYYGRAVITISGEVGSKTQFVVGVVPLLLQMEASASMQTDALIGYDLENSQWFCEGEMELVLPKIKASFGVGVAYVADISVYGSVKNIIKLDTKDDTVSASLDGEIGVSASLLFAHYSHKIWSGNMQYYYKDKSGEYYTDQPTTLRSLYRLSNYSIDRNYLNNRSGWNVGDVMLLSTDSGTSVIDEIITSKTLQESINYSATPKLLKLDDATEMLVWTMDIEDRTDGNHTAIVYSIHNVILDTWTDPAIIDDDGTADFYPEVLYSNGDVYVIWSDANKQFEEGFDLNDVISSCEITYAVYGKYTKSFGVATTITADSTADVKPVLVDNNGKVIAVWLNNPNNDLLAQSGTNYLMLKDLSSGTDVQTIVTTDKPILSVVPISVDGQFAVAYTQDLDGDLMTTADVEVFVFMNDASTQLTTNNESEGNLSAEVLNGKQCLLFYSDSGLKVSYDLTSVSNLLGTVGTAEYDIISQDGNDIIVYAVSSGVITQLYGCVVGNSSSEVLIGEVDGSVKDLAAVSSINGIVLSYVSSTQNTETLETSFNLCSATFDLFTDLTVYVNQDDVDHTGVTLSVPVEIANTGMETVNGYIINIYDETDSLIYSQIIEEQLMVGGAATKTMTIDGIAFPEQITDYVAEVLPVDGTVESNTNSAIFSIGFIDLSIDVSSFGADENAVFLIDLKNNTGVATPATVVVKNEAGNVVKTYSVDQFDGEYSFIIRASELGIGDMYHFEVVGEREDAYLGNNSDTGYVNYNIVMGDVNSDGVVDTLDRMALSRYLANWDDASEIFDVIAADVNSDGVVDTLDRMILNRYLANWEDYEDLLYAG